MRLSRVILAFGLLLAIGCSTSSKPRTDPSGLVHIASNDPGDLYAHPTRSIDDYDDFVVGDVALSYAPKQEPLSADDAQIVRTMVYEIVMRQIPALGQLAVREPGACTVELRVQLSELEFAKPGSRSNGGTTVTLEFRDSKSGDPLMRYGQHRELSIGPSTAAGRPDLKRLESTLEIVAEDVGLRIRKVLPVKETASARADRGCKGTIGEVRRRARQL